jgi:hypothetical protein
MRRAETRSRRVRASRRESSTGSAAEFAELQRETFGYFLHEANPGNGLIPDNTRYGAACSIAAVGLAMACYPVAARRGWLTRTEAAERTLATLRFFERSPQGPEPDATGYRGLYYHFLSMRTGRRDHGCEISTIDSAILLAGALTAGAFFDGPSQPEREIRELAESLYARAEWDWALHADGRISHGWDPERGFLPNSWGGYNETLILYVLALGSPTHPVGQDSYASWTKTYRWMTLYGQRFLYAGPLFTHQLSHIWIDFRGIADAYMRRRKIDYFENSRRATYVQQRYAMENPRGFEGYTEHCWGVTASDGPGNIVKRVAGVTRRFYDYRARGVPFGPDDGTISPWASVTSLPFAPEIVVPTVQFFNERYPHMRSRYGFLCSFNPTFPAESAKGWVAHGYFGLDQGPVVLMIENHQSEMLWKLMRRSPHLVRGLRRAGFRGGWLDRAPAGRSGGQEGRRKRKAP